MNILGLQLQIEAKRAADQTGYDVSEILKAQNGQLDLLQRFQNARIPNQRFPEPHKPIWMVPISRNPNFIGRDDLLEQLEDQLRQDDGYSATAVLYGLAGIGYVGSRIFVLTGLTDPLEEISGSARIYLSTQIN